MAAEKNQRGAVAISTAAALRFIYVFFPFVLIVPLELGIRHQFLPTQIREASLFAPLKWLYDHFEPYNKLIQSEEELLKRAGIDIY